MQQEVQYVGPDRLIMVDVTTTLALIPLSIHALFQLRVFARWYIVTTKAEAALCSPPNAVPCKRKSDQVPYSKSGGYAKLQGMYNTV
jgi:hypothetical protein